MFLAGGIYSLFHYGLLYIVSPRHGFALAGSFRITGAIGLILLGSGILCHRLVGTGDDRNGVRELLRFLAVLAGIAGVLLAFLAIFLHYSLTLMR